MADNVQPDAGEQRDTSSSGLLISTDPLQDEAGYKLSAADTDVNDAGDDDTDDGGPTSDGDAEGDTDGTDADGDADGSDGDGSDSE